MVLADVRQYPLEAASEPCARRGFLAGRHGIRPDVAGWSALAAAETERVFGRVPVRANPAGVGIKGPHDGITDADGDGASQPPPGGIIQGLQGFLPRIHAQGEGRHCVNTSRLQARGARASRRLPGPVSTC